jgi:GNAT superfamily N-acetyltransferase
LVALLDKIYTEPASWRRGLGRSLLDFALEQLRGKRFREVTLWTAEWNASRGFYEALGWSLDGATREKTFAGSTFTEVRYRTQVRG